MTTEEPFALRVLTLNTWGLRAPLAQDRIQRMQNIGDHVAQADYDVVALQEVWLRRSLPPLFKGAAAAGLLYHHVYSAPGFGCGLVILSRYPITAARFTPYSLRGGSVSPFGAEANASKGIGFACLETPVGAVDVYMSHLVAQYQADDLRDSFAAHRVAQIYELAQAINQRRSGHPTVICGDLNIQPQQWTYALFKAMTGAVDCLTAVQGETNEATYTAENPYVKASQQRLDYIFALDGTDHALQPVEAAVTMRTRQRHSTTSYSDHDAMFSVLQFKPQTTSVTPADPAAADLLTRLERRLDAGFLQAQKNQQQSLSVISWIIAVLTLLAVLWRGRGWQRLTFWCAVVMLVANAWRGVRASDDGSAFRQLLGQLALHTEAQVNN